MAFVRGTATVAGRLIGNTASGIRYVVTHPAARYAARQTMNFGGYAAGNGIRLASNAASDSFNYVRAHPRGSAITAATIAGTALGGFLGYNAPEFLVDGIETAADSPHYVADFIRYHNRHDRFTPWGLDGIATFLYSPAHMARNGYESAKTTIDVTGTAAGAAFLGSSAYRLSRRVFG